MLIYFLTLQPNYRLMVETGESFVRLEEDRDQMRVRLDQSNGEFRFFVCVVVYA